jgi:hypothetical protein
MKTPKEKAIELVEIFGTALALIAVDEINANHPHKIVEKFYCDAQGNKTDDNYFELVSNEFYWLQVKQELQFL